MAIGEARRFARSDRHPCAMASQGDTFSLGGRNEGGAEEREETPKSWSKTVRKLPGQSATTDRLRVARAGNRGRRRRRKKKVPVSAGWRRCSRPAPSSL